LPRRGGECLAQRQDSWALIQHDVPSVMVSTSYSESGRGSKRSWTISIIGHPTDEASRVVYGGMVDNVLVQTETRAPFRRYEGLANLLGAKSGAGLA